MRRGVVVAVVVALAVLAVSCGGSGASGHGARRQPGGVVRARPMHVAIVLMENKEDRAVLGTPAAPYLTRLARSYARVPQSYAIGHPSLPNYLALTSGSTHGIQSDCTDCHVDAPNLVDQLQARHISWKAYMQGMPTRCFAGAFAGRYAKKHDPFAYYDSVTRNPARCRRIVPYRELAADVRTGRMPTIAWITPDLCNDSHDCGVRAGDRFLAHVVPRLLRGVGPRGFVVVTYDEGSTDRGCCRQAHGGRIATVIAGADVKRGFRHAGPVDHFGTLGTIEEALGLAPLGGAADSRSGRFTDVFRHPPQLEQRRALR
jgi:phosphatidylinositol-3-phosphatase